MGVSRVLLVPFLTLGVMVSASAQGSAGAELTYFGRASIKIKTASGLVVYIDPYAPGDYSEPADLILVTHGHGDHNKVGMVSRTRTTVVAAPVGAVSGRDVRIVAEGDTFQVGTIAVRVMPAANKNHARSESRGYLVSFDGITVYHAGDTDYLAEMAGYGAYDITYALLPCDGFYNMGPDEASKCAEAMKAGTVIPIHSSKDGVFGEKNARAVRAKNLIVLKPGEKTALHH